MMLAPSLTATLISGGRWYHWVTVVAWVTAYLAYMALRGVTSRRPRGYVGPLVTYTLLCLAAVVTLLTWRPALVWWALPLALLLAISSLLIAAGRERSVANDAVMMALSCLMAVVIATLDRLGTGWSWAAYAGSTAPWLLAAVFAAYFWGTITYVKCLIRERGKTSWYVASVVYHAALVVPGFLIHPAVGAVACLIVLRAAVVPRAWPKAKPKWIGLGEVAITVVVMLVTALTIAQWSAQAAV